MKDKVEVGQYRFFYIFGKRRIYKIIEYVSEKGYTIRLLDGKEFSPWSEEILLEDKLLTQLEVELL